MRSWTGDPSQLHHTACPMSSSDQDSDLEHDIRHRDLGVTVASAFFRNRPQQKVQPCEEKKILTASWAPKGKQVRRIYEYFENEISQVLHHETDLLVRDIVPFVKSQASQALGYIPTAIIRHGVRMTDRDAVFDLLERGLSESGCAAQVVRMEASHTTDVESMKRKIISDLMTDQLFNQLSGREKVRKTYEQRLPFKYFAQSFAASDRQKGQRRPVVVLIEELERADAEALIAFFSMIRNNMQEMSVVLMLGCCTSQLSLRQLLPTASFDMLFLQTFRTSSAGNMFARVMDQILMSSDVYSFKLGPACLRLMEDNFCFFNFSLEKILSIVKLMIIRHVGQNSCSLLSFASAAELKQALKQMSKNDLKQLRSDVLSLPSVAPVMSELRSISPKDMDTLRNFIKRSVNQIHNCHKDYLISMKCLSVLTSRTGEGDAGDQQEKTSITPFLLIKMPDDGDITETNEFKNIARSLSSLCLDDMKQRLGACINNHLSSESSISPLLKTVYENLLQLEKDAAISACNKQRTPAASNDPVSSSPPAKSQSRITFEGCKSRHDWKARLKESLPGRSEATATRENATSQRKRSKFEEFRGTFVSSVCQFFAQLTPPFSLPLSEVVYFSDAAFIADHYFAATRTTIIESLRHPLALRSSSNGETSEGDEGETRDDHEAVLDMERIYKQLASSSVSISMFDLMQSLQAQKASPSDLADVSPRKKVRTSKHSQKANKQNTETSTSVERQRFFTLINDLEYIGILQKDKRKAGRLSKLAWEAAA